MLRFKNILHTVTHSFTVCWISSLYVPRNFLFHTLTHFDFSIHDVFIIFFYELLHFYWTHPSEKLAVHVCFISHFSMREKEKNRRGKILSRWRKQVRALMDDAYIHSCCLPTLITHFFLGHKKAKDFDEHPVRICASYIKNFDQQF